MPAGRLGDRARIRRAHRGLHRRDSAVYTALRYTTVLVGSGYLFLGGAWLQAGNLPLAAASITAGILIPGAVLFWG